MDKLIFVIDDSDTDLVRAENALEEKYDVITMNSPWRLFEILALKKKMPDLILLDIEMPGMDGFETLRRLKSDSGLGYIPVIFMTSYRNAVTESQFFELGAADVVLKPISYPILLNRVKLHIDLSQVIRQHTAQLQDAHRNMIYVLSSVVGFRDKYTGGHIERTAKYIQLLVHEMRERGIYTSEMKNWEPDMLPLFALLHDVGKISIKDSLLNKDSSFTDEEHKLMQEHVNIGVAIIQRVIDSVGSNIFLEEAKKFTAYHHENWDGTGYPNELSGFDIPLAGRVMAVADVYDALVTERPYKRAFTHEEAVATIKSDIGTKFEPVIAEAFLAALESDRGEHI